jgi:plastocyanin
VLLVALVLVGARPRRMPRAAQGRIEGTVQLAPGLAVKKPRIRLYGDYGPGSQPPRPPPAGEVANVVIYLDSMPASGEAAPSAKPLRIEQRDETFVPHVLPVLRGSTVEFPNGDPLFHNVFSLSSAKTFDLGRYPKGTSKSVRFDRSGIVQVFCHIHSDMSAVVLVLDNAWFAVPLEGRYVIPDVPPGEYRLVAWHERIKPIVEHVKVSGDAPTVVDWIIPLPPPEESRP